MDELFTEYNAVLDSLSLDVQFVLDGSGTPGTGLRDVVGFFKHGVSGH